MASFEASLSEERENQQGSGPRCIYENGLQPGTVLGVSAASAVWPWAVHSNSLSLGCPICQTDDRGASFLAEAFHQLLWVKVHDTCSINAH